MTASAEQKFGVHKYAGSVIQMRKGAEESWSLK
jgi:hypothetical protein